MNKNSQPPANASLSAKAVICNEKGLHARASAMFVKCAQQYDSEIMVRREGETVSGHSIMDLLMLAAPKGTELTITASGPQAKEALAALKQLVDKGFYEDNEA